MPYDLTPGRPMFPPDRTPPRGSDMRRRRRAAAAEEADQLDDGDRLKELQQAVAPDEGDRLRQLQQAQESQPSAAPARTERLKELQQAVEDDWRSPEIYCPRCEYLLRSVEEAGLQQCPECGKKLDFELLRQQKRVPRFQPRPLPNRLFWKVTVQPARFFAGVQLWQFDGRILDSSGYLPTVLVLSLGAVAMTVAGVAGMLFRAHFLELAVITALMLLAAGPVTAAWLHLLLRMAGHPHPSQGRRRVMYFAGVPRAGILAIIPVLAVLAGLMSLLVGPAWIFFLACYAALWLNWAQVVLRAYQAETRSLSTMTAALAYFSPGLVAGVGIPLAAVVMYFRHLAMTEGW